MACWSCCAPALTQHITTTNSKHRRACARMPNSCTKTPPDLFLVPTLDIARRESEEGDEGDLKAESLVPEAARNSGDAPRRPRLKRRKGRMRSSAALETTTAPHEPVDRTVLSNCTQSHLPHGCIGRARPVRAVDTSHACSTAQLGKRAKWRPSGKGLETDMRAGNSHAGDLILAQVPSDGMCRV